VILPGFSCALCGAADIIIVDPGQARATDLFELPGKWRARPAFSRCLSCLLKGPSYAAPGVSARHPGTRHPDRKT
jgi:hypothetical protein